MNIGDTVKTKLGLRCWRIKWCLNDSTMINLAKDKLLFFNEMGVEINEIR